MHKTILAYPNNGAMATNRKLRCTDDKGAWVDLDDRLNALEQDGWYVLSTTHLKEYVLFHLYRA